MCSVFETPEQEVHILRALLQYPRDPDQSEAWTWQIRFQAPVTSPILYNKLPGEVSRVLLKYTCKIKWVSFSKKKKKKISYLSILNTKVT